MHYYQHHIGDFIKDTANLTDEQLAAYVKMLWIYYTSEKPFTDAAEDIAFAVRSNEKTVQLLLRHFFVKRDDGWHQTRCDEEISEFHKKADKARSSANARWKNADGMRTHSKRKASATKGHANQEPITNNQEPDDSVPNGTGSDAAKSPEELTKDELWSAGKSLLQQSGMPARQCGSFVGKLVKDYGDDVVVQAVRAAVVVRPVDCVEYLTAACKRISGERKPANKQAALEDRNRQVAAAWADEHMGDGFE